MATDDDKQIPKPDPWAGLEVGGAEDKGEEFTFDFAGLEDDAAVRAEPSAEFPADHAPSDSIPAHAGEDPVVASIHQSAQPAAAESDGTASDGDRFADEGHRDVAADETPLVVFPPPDAEVNGSEVLIGTGRSGILSMPNAADAFGEEDVDGHDANDDGFDDDDIARELGLMEGEAGAGETLDDGGFGDRDDLGGAADFGESFAETPPEEVSFDAGMMAGTLPFADGEQVASMADVAESEHGDPASIPLTTALAATGVAVAASTAGGGAPAVKKKKQGGGLGQMVGVVLGGLMALPITYAILIWGFQKDPFKFGKQVPPQLAFLLPQKLQPGYKPPRKADTGPSLDAAPSLDDLPTAEAAAPEPAETTATQPAEAESEEAVESAESTTPEPMRKDAVAGTSADTAADPETAEPDDSATSGAEQAGEAVAPVVVAAPAMVADASLAALPKVDALPGLDSLVADAGVAVVAPVPATVPAALPPLDLSGVDTAAERAAVAFDALDAMADPFSPDRDRLLVSWYRRLAQLGEELVRLETMAADSGRPLSPTPASATDLLDRVSASDTAVADLDRLGGMWLTSQKRRADGVALVVTLGASRQVGPYWSTRCLVSGAQEDGTDRTMAIISRQAPPVDIGERVVVSGVMFDGDAVWAADMRPVITPPPSEGDPE